MKKNKALIMWGAVAAVAIAAALFDFQWEKTQETRKLEKSKVLAFEASQIKSFELTGGPFTIYREGSPLVVNKFRLAKHDDGWMIESPIEERANQDASQGFVEGLAQERASELKMSGPVDWSQYGLETAKGSVVVTDTNGKSVTILVGSRKNFEGDAYLRRGDENTVLLATNSWHTRAEKTLMDFRDKRILRESAMKIQKIKITANKTTTTFQQKDSKWIVLEHPDWKLDQNKVREIISAVVADLISEYKFEGAVAPAELKKMGFAAVNLKVEAEIDGAAQPWQAEFSEVKGNSYLVKVSNPVLVVAVNTMEVSKLAKINLDELRDKQGAFRFELSTAARVDIQRGLSHLVAKKEKDQWILEKNEGTEAATTGETLGVALQSLSDLEVRDFVSNEDLKKVANKDNSGKDHETHWKIQDAQGNVLADLIFSHAHRRKVEGEDRWVIVARGVPVGGAVAVDLAKMTAMKLGNLIDLPVTANEAAAPPDKKNKGLTTAPVPMDEPLPANHPSIQSPVKAATPPKKGKR